MGEDGEACTTAERQDKSRKVRPVDMSAISTTRETLRTPTQLAEIESALVLLSFRYLATYDGEP
jgi:hypothetical protein